MSFYLALDVGGTKTDYALADETHEIARVRTGTIKRMRTDDATATVHLESALADLTALSGVDMKAIRRTCIGTAGETVPLVADWLHAAFDRRVSGERLLLGDVEIALDAAFPGQPGIVVIAGTGSNVAGRAHNGALLNAGGWGPALADQGSGHRIGLQALRAAFLAIDEALDDATRAVPTKLMPAILDFWKLPSREHLIEYANSIPAPDFSALTGLVVAVAEDGDATAKAVMQREGESLAYLVRLIARRLRTMAPDPEWVPQLAFTGSILEKVAPVREALMASLQAEFPTMQTPSEVIDPIAGAIWRARNG
ncbi:BadF-type ATPase [Granulicella pectinivorans]|jgi:N-acetylglucosamine kinase-like BadF-type ATPase|uniref:BadF-type ATPase n=1 Tax=Granulicella pectinivorans TaxID=474950 RepID=A0A1I6MRK1_9BACT|nr:BadF/BadG/BcrA/BcrD ATPase family protein [Granulicella pectinivorans]SFS18237.1 BadF-type ATPase [Granulicella pectinivorans]